MTELRHEERHALMMEDPPKWLSADGRVTPVAAMAPHHLLNTVAMMNRWVLRIVERHGREFEVAGAAPATLSMLPVEESGKVIGRYMIWQHILLLRLKEIVRPLPRDQLLEQPKLPPRS